MRKQLFRWIDSLLPRSVTLLPYCCAIWVLRGFIGIGLQAWVWNRNSTRNGAFIFGVSDLDVTVVSSGTISFEFLRSILAGMKKIFIFLGEVNLYEFDHLPFVLERMNTYEFYRDPELKAFHPLNKLENNVEKFVFIQRMLFSDIFSLTSDPSLRQSKWKSHFELIGYENDGKCIDVDFVINVLNHLCDHNPRITTALDNWLTSVLKKDYNCFHQDMGEGFKILAPHCHLWFHHSSEESFLKGLNDFERSVVRAQINWEFWGLYCQRFNLTRNDIIEHLNRLQRVYTYCSSEAESVKLGEEISLVF